MYVCTYIKQYESKNCYMYHIVAYGIDLMQRRSFARVRARGHASPSGSTLELERYHTRARVVPHSSSSSTTRELEWCHTRVRVVSLSSPRIATRSAIALAQTPDLLFSAFLS